MAAKERPILFSAPMVRAILARRKKQTRRLVKPVGSFLVDGGGRPFTQRWDEEEGVNWRRDVRCPHGQPGDRLWVKETWAICRPLRDCEGVLDDEQNWSGPPPKLDPRGKRLLDDWVVGYRASNVGDEGPWRPSIYMPRWASRITLEITEVRVQRLQDISEEDAKAEGAELAINGVDEIGEPTKGYRTGFVRLWQSINGKKPGASWADNPWVWAITFLEVKR